jgi:hypothetical protein
MSLKMRQTVEFNAFEWIVACVLKKRNVKPSEYMTVPILYNKTSDALSYQEDLKRRPARQVNRYSDQFVKELEKYPQLHEQNIQQVCLTGKNCCIHEVLQLNKGEDKLEAKGDVYALLNDGTWIGVSVKQDKKATKSNYSVHSMFSHTDNLHLTQLKKKYLAEHGFLSFQKSQRSQVNRLFYQDNPYWTALKAGIQTYNPYIKTFLYDKLFASSLKYPLYEFDSRKLTLLSKEMSVVTLEEHESYYFTKGGKRRNAAKLFYLLTVNEKRYRVEIRWKGNIFTASPQFQIHEE